MGSFLNTAVVAGLAILMAFASPAAPRSVTVLGTTLIDSSTEGDYGGERADQTRRIALVTERLEEAFAEQGWRVIDAAPVADELERILNPARCNGCDARLARILGAEIAVTAEVQKVSNLILTINVVLRDAASGRLVRAGNADIRSNTDVSWRRGVDYVLRNRIFPELASATPD